MKVKIFTEDYTEPAVMKDVLEYYFESLKFTSRARKKAEIGIALSCVSLVVSVLSFIIILL